MPLSRLRGIVVVVTDRERLLPGGAIDAQVHALAAQAAAAAAAGADCFHVRERDLDGRTLVAVVREILTVVRSRITVLVNDRLDIALAAGAHGVQLPQHGLWPREARRIVPAGFIIGQSIHGDAPPDGQADFAVFGTVFPSASKERGHVTAGPQALGAAARQATVPVVAIGGIHAGNVAEVAPFCAGVAAIGWFATTSAGEMSAVVRAARRAFDTIPSVI